MSRKHRKALKEEVRSYIYNKPTKGFKTYMLTYGSELLYTIELPEWDTMNKKEALYWINEHFSEEGRTQVNNVKKVNFFRVA